MFFMASAYVQRVRGDGGIADGWPIDGIALGAGAVNAVPSTPVSDGESGAYVAWSEDDPSASTTRAFLQRVGAEGTIAPAAPITDLTLYPARPNPAVGTVNFGLVLRRSAPTSVTIVDVLGRSVRRLVRSELLEAGPHPMVWDGRDEEGRRSGPGIYFALVRAGGSRLSEWFALIR
jgi:hypothetical protein